MSRNVDVRDPSKLSDADLMYAYDRNMVGDEVLQERGLDPTRSVAVDGPPHTRPHTGDANTRGLTQDDLDARTQDEDFEPAERNLTEPQLQGYEEPEPLERDEDDSGPEDVANDITVTRPAGGWGDLTVEQLRVACVERELSSTGNKSTLVNRLDRYDAGEEEEPEEV